MASNGVLHTRTGTERVYCSAQVSYVCRPLGEYLLCTRTLSSLLALVSYLSHQTHHAIAIAGNVRHSFAFRLNTMSKTRLASIRSAIWHQHYSRLLFGDTVQRAYLHVCACATLARAADYNSKCCHMNSNIKTCVMLFRFFTREHIPNS